MEESSKLTPTEIQNKEIMATVFIDFQLNGVTYESLCEFIDLLDIMAKEDHSDIKNICQKKK